MKGVVFGVLKIFTIATNLLVLATINVPLTSAQTLKTVSSTD